MKTVFIYCLKDPATGDVRYIGQTNNLKKRLNMHRTVSSKKQSHLGCWLRSLISRGVAPVLSVLHEVSENESWEEEERRYISCARALGVDLVNATDGGEGTSGIVATPERRASLKAAWTPERRAAQSARQKGVPRSPETCAAISVAKTGVSTGPRSPEACAAISAAKKGVPIGPPSIEARAAQSAAQRGVPQSPERRAARIGVLRGPYRRRAK